jgi:hypothetical protein
VTKDRVPIVPWEHPRYQHFYVDGDPEIALTYQWSTTFRHIKAMLDPSNIAMHNQATIDSDPSMWERLYLMSFLWVFLGPMHKIPLDMEQRLIFIDIMMNDQTKEEAIERELDKAEGFYRRARHHVILGTDGVFSRAWCLYEIAVRREAWKRSQLLLARCVGPEVGIRQIEITMLGVGGLLLCIFWRISTMFFSYWTLIAIAKMFCVNGIASSLFKTVSNASVLAVSIVSANRFQYYEKMEAFKDSDKQGIRQKINCVFGDNDPDVFFNGVIGSATVHSNSSRLSFSLLLWMETIIFGMSIPFKMAFAAFGLTTSPILILIWKLGSMCVPLLHSWYLKFADNIEENTIQRFGLFGSKVLKLCFYIDLISSMILVGILMSIPSAAILGSIGGCLYLLKFCHLPDNNHSSSIGLASTLVQ